jgi:hypothetical protein
MYHRVVASFVMNMGCFVARADRQRSDAQWRRAGMAGSCYLRVSRCPLWSTARLTSFGMPATSRRCGWRIGRVRSTPLLILSLTLLAATNAC